MEDVFADARMALSDLFGVPASWFRSPVFIINLIVPVILTVAFYYLLLTKKLKIFKSGGTAVFVVAICCAFFTIPVIKVQPYIAIFASTVGIIVLSGGKISFKRLFFGFFVGGFAWWLAVQAANLLPKLLTFT